MGFLDRAIKRGISNAVGSAVEQSVKKVVAPKVEQVAANAVNSAASKFNQATGTQQPAQAQAQSTVNQAELNQAANTLGGLFGGFTQAATSFANEAAKNMKICPSCNQAAGAGEKFCQACGTKLPEETVAQGALCPSCGNQNSIGTKFCSGCGTKLPGAIAEEQAAQARDAAVMQEWSERLSAYPRWNGGGSDCNIEQYDGYIMFAAKLQNAYAAQNAVNQYRELLKQNGFRSAGEYPCVEHLYKMANGVCFHCDTEHCFDGDSDHPTLYFDISEPSGGFNYVKPQPKKATSIMDLFK